DGLYAFTNALVDSKLYIMGGMIGPHIYKDVFYLDFSITLDTLNPSYEDLPLIPVYSAWGTASVGGLDKSKIFLIGGEMLKLLDLDFDIYGLSNSSVYIFDTINQEWTVPAISGIQPSKRRLASSIFDPDSGWIYIFGGVTNNYTMLFNDFIVLDSINLSWVKLNSSSNILPRASHTATLIANSTIVFIGGLEMTNDSINIVNISQIWTYEIKSGTWTSHVSSSPDGNIIIYSGMGENDSIAKPELIVLNVQTTPYQWIVPSIPPDNAPPSQLLLLLKII
ncbi:4826_t:CDS:2, partial [Dentiscutata erythropus]